MALTRLHLLPLLSILLPLMVACSGRGSSAPNPTRATSPAAATETPPAIGDTVRDTHDSILVVYQTANGDHWFGSSGHGLYRYDGKHLIQFTKEDGLCHNTVWAIQEDKSGRIFITTMMGISMYDGRTFRTLEPVESGPAGDAWTMGPDDLWFKGHYGQSSVYRWDGQFLHHLEFPKFAGEDEYYAKFGKMPWSPYDVYKVYTDRSGAIWFGTAAFGLYRFDGRTVCNLYEDHLTNTPSGGSFGIRSILEDSKGRFWICNTQYSYRIQADGVSKQLLDSNGNALLRYKRDPGIAVPRGLTDEDPIYFMGIVEDKTGDLWMVTFDTGVFRYDGKQLRHYDIKKGDQVVTLYAIYIDRDGQMWLGTHTDGAYRWDGSGFVRAGF